MTTEQNPADGVESIEDIDNVESVEDIDDVEAIADADGTVSADEAGKDADAAKQPKKKRRTKLLVALGVVVVVFVAAGVGVFIWHEQPSFCSAICHSPMDSYVDNYYGDNTTLSVVAHRVGDVACLECHESDIPTQITEATAWLSGDFTDPLALRRFGTVDFCGRCHDDSNADNGLDWEEIVASTANYQNSGRNPHESHLGRVDCYTCHSVHRESKLYCTQCHDNMSQPEAWRS